MQPSQGISASNRADVPRGPQHRHRLAHAAGSRESMRLEAPLSMFGAAPHAAKLYEHALLPCSSAVECPLGGTGLSPSQTSSPSSPAAPAANDNAAKARALLDLAIQTLGGSAYLNLQDMTQTGRTYSFHRGEATSA